MKRVLLIGLLTILGASTAEAQFYFSPQFSYRIPYPSCPYPVPVRPLPAFGTVIVVSAPPVIAIPNRPPGIVPFQPDPQREAITAAQLKASIDRGDFLVFRPKKNEPPFELPPLPERPAVLAVPIEPKARSQYFVDRAQESFLAEEPGRSAERLQTAIELNPAEALNYFLLAQVRLSRGEYGDAVAAIRDGMKRSPDWPLTKFDPRGFYGPTPERYEADLKALKAALDAAPNDPALLFLYGYQLWFLGDRKEAATYLKKASARTKENAIIERFLAETMG